MQAFHVVHQVFSIGRSRHKATDRVFYQATPQRSPRIPWPKAHIEISSDPLAVPTCRSAPGGRFGRPRARSAVQYSQVAPNIYLESCVCVCVFWKPSLLGCVCVCFGVQCFGGASPNRTEARFISRPPSQAEAAHGRSS